MTELVAHVECRYRTPLAESRTEPASSPKCNMYMTAAQHIYLNVKKEFLTQEGWLEIFFCKNTNPIHLTMRILESFFFIYATKIYMKVKYLNNLYSCFKHFE